MEKTKLNLELILPDIPDERDACVARIISELENSHGIQKVHIVPSNGSAKAQLCFHYDPDLILADQVEKLAEQAGAKITNQYHHLLVEATGIRHQRQTRVIEAELKDVKGIMLASVSASGMLSIEFDTSLITEHEVLHAIEKTGLKIPHDHEDHQHHDHQSADKNDHGSHEHSHAGIFGKNSEIIFSIFCGIFLATGFGLSFVKSVPAIVPLVLYIGAYFCGGFFTTKEAAEAISKGKFEIDFLMLVAAIGAAILGNWAEGALLLFLFSLSHALEHYAMEKARKSIAALSGLAPKTALLKVNDVIKEVHIDELKPGDTVVIKPDSRIAADGIIITGSSNVNQAPITGESIPVEKTAYETTTPDISKENLVDQKHKVFAGTINGNQLLETIVTKPASDSTIARLIKMVNEAQTQKSPTQHLADKFEKYYVPAVLILVVLLCFAFLVIDESFSSSFYRAMSVLVAASPCALAISTPSAVLSGVARAARAGVLIKGGKPLEDLGVLSAIAFDKTGTLTEGKPRLTHVLPSEGISENELLKTVVAVESFSDHPIARAIVRDAKQKLGNIEIPQATGAESVSGKGIHAKIGSDDIYIGNTALIKSIGNFSIPDAVNTTVKELESGGNTTMIIRRNNEIAGIISVMDIPRTEAKQAIAQLKSVGIERMIMLTGDNQQVANAVAGEIGITEAWGSLLPEQKVDAIKKLMAAEKKVAMVGDGVNDAPAMASSTVGIAMGAAGSDVALETADIALMGDKLSLLPFAIGLSRKARRIIRQNLVISLGMVAILIPLTISGLATIGPAVIGHEGSTLVVVFNALRLLGYRLNSSSES